MNRVRTGKKELSQEKIMQSHSEMAFHLRKMKREYENGLQQCDVENFDEYNFEFDLTNDRVLDFKGKKRVSYAEVCSGREKLTVCMRIAGGPECRLENPMIISQNSQRNYPIRGLQDNIEGVCYRTQPRGYMDSVLFPEHFGESRAISTLPQNRTRVLFVDSCSAHRVTNEHTEALNSVQTILRRFPSNCTHLMQPLINWY